MLPICLFLAAHSMPSTFRMRASRRQGETADPPFLRKACPRGSRSDCLGSFLVSYMPLGHVSCFGLLPHWRRQKGALRSSEIPRSVRTYPSEMNSLPSRALCTHLCACIMRRLRAARPTAASPASPGPALVVRRTAPARPRGGVARKRLRRRSGGSIRRSCRRCWRRVRNRPRPFFAVVPTPRPSKPQTGSGSG